MGNLPLMILGYWKTGVGRNGDRIPVPPEWNSPLKSQLAIALQFALAIGGAMGLIGIVKVIPAFFSVPAPSMEDLVQRAVWIITIAFGTGFSCVIVVVGISAIFWPFSRRSLGEFLEDAIDAKSLSELESEIKENRDQLQYKSGMRRRDFESRLNWLEAKRNSRLSSVD